MKTKSIKTNALLNTIQTVLTMIFPLITFPYVTRILGVTEMGRYNFSASIISYFVLLSGLGISTYAIREGARLRDDKEKIEKFTTDVFSINIYSTIISYVVLLFCLWKVEKLHGYSVIILMLSIQMFFTLIGRLWIYSIFEDYLFITVCSILSHVLAIVLLFTFVKNQSDVVLYAMSTVFGAAASNFIAFLNGKKYCKYHFTLRPSRVHFIPIILIFSTSISIVIYGNSDMTMLGFFGLDYNVGIYGVSVKIYNVVKQIVAAILTVTIPRFSYYLGKNELVKYNALFSKVINNLLLIMLPAAVGLACVAKECILLLSGKEYIQAVVPLRILCLAMVFNLIAYMLGYCVLIPNRNEKHFFIATIVSATVNIILNFIFIPLYMQNAAAITTVIAEIVASIICIYYSHGKIKWGIKKRNVISILIGCLLIVIACLFIDSIGINSNVCALMIKVMVSVVVFIIIQLINKNNVFKDSMQEIMSKISGIWKK